MLLLEGCGYFVSYVSYWNMSLFAPAALARIFNFSGESFFKMSSAIDKIFYFILNCESLLIPHFFMPFGTGIVELAKRN